MIREAPCFMLVIRKCVAWRHYNGALYGLVKSEFSENLGGLLNFPFVGYQLTPFL